MRFIILFISTICAFLGLYANSYANTDYIISTQPDYRCENGQGILTLVFGSTRHHVDTRYYHIDQAGYISIQDGYNTTIPRSWNWYIPGCGCPSPDSSVRTVKAFNGSQVKRDADGPDYRFYPNWLEYWPFRSGPYPHENPWGNYRVVDYPGQDFDAWFGNTTTNVTFYPAGNGVPNNPVCYPAACDPSVANPSLRSTPLTAGKCADGTAANFISSTDATGKTTYSWTCQKTGGNPVSCNAYYKPVCKPTATNGCCDETRAPEPSNADPTQQTQLPQCQYSVLLNNPTYNLIGGIMPTQTGPVTLGITGTKNCRPPVDGKPRIKCDADGFTTISGTLSSFTLPSTVTQKSGKCNIVFDAPDVCKPRTTDVIEVRAQPCDISITDKNHPLYCGKCDPKDPTCKPPCDPAISNPKDQNYCERTATTTNVCVKLTDKFGNPVYNFATNKITSVLGKVVSNEYYEKHNTGKDPTVYAPGTFTVVGNEYCQTICTMVGGTKCCPGSTDPVCNPQPPVECDPSITDKNNPRYCPPPTTCIETASGKCCPTKENNYCGTTSSCDPAITDKTKVGYCCDESITDKNNPRYCEGNPETQPGCELPGGKCITNPCTPTKENNYCNPIGNPETQPGCELPGGKCITIEKKKACTGYLEVWDGTRWTRDGESILYDEPNAYRIVISDTDAICRDGIASIQEIYATGGSLTGGVTYGDGGIFRTTITKRPIDTPKTQRGVMVKAIFTQPGGITYGLTENANDFNDTPLSITGNRMKGVRIIGNSAGTTVTNFNLNNAGVIGEQTGPATVAARNAMIKNAALLTRGIEPNGDRTINGIYYAEGNFNYSLLASKGFKTLILKGNLTIDTNIPEGSNIGIIVLSKDSGTDGNIIIGDNVTFIHALVFAEGTFRGSSTNADTLNPKLQLVLKGSLFSRNTIGGSADIDNLYLAGGAKTTDRNTAFIQDLNTVRNGNGEATYKNYKDPFIIDFDNMQASPPPGFTISL